MKVYNDRNHGSIEILREFFPTKNELNYEIVYVGNICHTNTGENFKKITDALLDSKELFIAKENFFCKTSLKYQKHWLEYFNEKSIDLGLETIETDNLYIIKRGAYE